MKSDTSTEPVQNQFSLKALVLASSQSMKSDTSTKPVQNQYLKNRDSGTPLKKGTGSGVNQYSRQGGKANFETGEGKRLRENKARFGLSSLPGKEAPVSMGWGAEHGEVDAVAAMAREKFPEPPIDGRAFPHFPTFCAGYGKGCGRCRFFRMGRGPFCAVWGAAWPKFQRDAETDTATW